MRKLILLLLISICLFFVVGCVSEPQSVSGTSFEETVVSLNILLSKRIPNTINIYPYNEKKIIAKGIVLNDLQTETLLGYIIHLPKGNYIATHLEHFNAVFLGALELKNNIITAQYLILSSDLKLVYLVNYDYETLEILGYINSGQVIHSDLLFEDNEISVVWSIASDIIISENQSICIKHITEETTRTIADNKEMVTYRSFVNTYYRINDKGQFEIIKTETVSEGERFKNLYKT